MLLRVGQFRGSRVLALDAILGTVRDVYFDDSAWTARYLVVGTGRWWPGTSVLISPQSVELIDSNLHTVVLSLTRERVEASATVNAHEPVSHRLQSEFQDSYIRQVRWSQVGQLGDGAPFPPLASPQGSDLPRLDELRHEAALSRGDFHLRSAKEVTGYSIAAIDGVAGHITDFLFDDETWSLRYLIVKLGVWPFAHHVLLSRESVKHIDWAAKQVNVSRSRREIECATDYDPEAPPPGDIAVALSENRSRRSRH